MFLACLVVAQSGPPGEESPCLFVFRHFVSGDLLSRLAGRQPQPQHKPLALLMDLPGLLQWGVGGGTWTAVVAIMAVTQTTSPLLPSPEEAEIDIILYVHSRHWHAHYPKAWLRTNNMPFSRQTLGLACFISLSLI